MVKNNQVLCAQNHRSRATSTRSNNTSLRRIALIWLLTLLCLSSLSMGVGAKMKMVAEAPEVLITDQANLLGPVDKADLAAQLAAFTQRHNCRAYVLTVSNAGGRSSEKVADDALVAHTPQEVPGVLFLVDLDNRRIHISTQDRAIKVLTDRRIEKILDVSYPAFKANDYAAGFSAMIRKTNEYFETTVKKVSLGEGMVASAVATVGGLIHYFKTKSSHKARTHAWSFNPAQYAAVNLADAGDALIDTIVTQRVIPRSSSSGGGGGSSTHTHSSGRSMGGGGRSL